MLPSPPCTHWVVHKGWPRTGGGGEDTRIPACLHMSHAGWVTQGDAADQAIGTIGSAEPQNLILTAGPTPFLGALSPFLFLPQTAGAYTHVPITFQPQVQRLGSADGRTASGF